jgi:hypothetical protein
LNVFEQSVERSLSNVWKKVRSSDGSEYDGVGEGLLGKPVVEHLESSVA